MKIKILFVFVFAMTLSEVLGKKPDDHGPIDDILTAANIGRFVIRRIHRHRNRGHSQSSYGDRLVKLNFDKSLHFHQHEHQHKHNHKNYVKHVDHEHVENVQHGPAQRPILNQNNRQRLNRLVQSNNRIIPHLNRPGRTHDHDHHDHHDHHDRDHDHPPHHHYDFEHAIPDSINFKPEDVTESSYVPYAVLN